MTCPNCKSSDIIGIQGQHYCINCGQQVPDLATNVPTPPPEIVEAIKDTPLKLSEPSEPSEQTVAPKTTRRSEAVVPAEKLANVSLKKSAPSRAAKSQKRTMDMKKVPKKASPAASVTVADAVAVAAPKQPESTEVTKPVASVLAEAPSARAKETAHLAPNHPARTAWHIATTKFWPALFLYSVALAVVQLGLRLRLSPELASWMPHSIRLQSMDAASLDRALTIGLVASLCASSLYLFRTYLNAKLIFVTTKQLDNRAIGARQAELMAASSLWGLIGLDALALILFVGLAFVELGLIRGINLLSWHGIIQPVLLTVGNFVIIYAGLGVAIARLMAQRLLVMSDKKPGEAFRISWRMFEHHSGDLILWGLQAVMVSFILLAPLTLMIRAVATSPFATSPSVIMLGLIVAAGSLSYYLVAAFTLSFWTSSYHALVDRVEASQRQSLMTGRHAKAALSSTAGVLAVLILMIAVFAAGLYYHDTIVRALLPQLQNRLGR